MTNSEIHDCIFENYMQYRNGELTLPDNTEMYDAFITAQINEAIRRNT